MDARSLGLALRGRLQADGSWMARCPAHEDKTASLHISPGHEGAILLKCFAGCEFEKVRQACRDRGVWHDPEPKRSNGAHYAPRPKANGHDQEGPAAPLQASLSAIMPVPPTATPFDAKSLMGGQATAWWDYLDSQGRLLGYVVRGDRTDGTKAWVKPAVWTEAGWKCQAFPTPRPLYGLAELAARPDATVLIVEGEKTTCAARELFEDYVCITWPGGASAVKHADWRPLKGRRVTIWPDADAPGINAAQAIADAALKTGAAEAHIVTLPEGLPGGWDLADEIPAGMDIAKLIADAVDVRDARVAALPLKSASIVETATYPALHWAVPGLIPDGVTILAGPKSRGKSFLSLDFAVSVALGGASLGNIPCELGACLYLALEDSERRIQGRMKTILQGRKAPAALDIATEWRVLPDGLDDIETWITATPKARLVIVDVLAKVKGSPDHRRGVYDQDYALITPFHALARKYGIAIVLVHHTNKGTAADPVLRISGTMGLSGAADTTLVLSREARDMHGTLDVRGRDVPEREIALQFDPETGCATQIGAAEDFRKSEERRAIIRTLIAGGPMSPTEISQAIGKKPGAARFMLCKMKRDGEITALANGKYQANE